MNRTKFLIIIDGIAPDVRFERKIWIWTQKIHIHPKDIWRANVHLKKISIHFNISCNISRMKIRGTYPWI